MDAIKEGVDVVMLIVDATHRLEEINHLIKAMETHLNKFDTDLSDEVDGSDTKEKKRRRKKSETGLPPLPPKLAHQTSQSKRTKLIAVLNKADLVFPRERLDELREELKKTNLFYDVFWISALKGHGLEQLKQFFRDKCARRAPWEFSAETVSDLSLEQRVNEITREKLFKRLNAEVPYQLVIHNTKFQHVPDTSLFVAQTVWCKTTGQKRIVISALKYVHQRAHANLLIMFPTIPKEKIFLNFNVRVGEPGEEGEEEGGGNEDQVIGASM